MAYTPITAENATNFAPGTRVEFNYGAMHSSEMGTVVGYGTSRFGAFLLAVTDDGESKAISGFTTTGIGVYLREQVTPAMVVAMAEARGAVKH